MEKPLATKEQIDQLDAMNSVVVDIAHIMAKLRNLPKGREKAVVVTKLQEATFWAKEDIELNHKL